MTQSEIQIGILKKLAGTTLQRHDEAYHMVYSDIPPYDILSNSALSFKDIQQMKRFARFWNLYYNSGNFKKSIITLWSDGDVFKHFFAFSLWVYQETQSTWKISLERLAQLLFRYRTEEQSENAEQVAALLLHDLLKLEGRKVPNFLKPFAYQNKTLLPKQKASVQGHNKRQNRHLA
jgi:hypothetical protein